MMIHQGAFPGPLSCAQDELIWQLTERVFDAYNQGKPSDFQTLQAAMTWKGTTSLFGWSGLVPTLDPSLRGPSAYVLGHRFRHALKRPEDAAAFFLTACADAMSGSVLKPLADAALAKGK